MPVIIIGSGFAAYQLVRMIRRQNSEQAITVITENSGDEYSKPDLSHVFTKKQMADDLVKMTGCEFAKEFDVRLMSYTTVETVHPEEKYIVAGSEKVSYDKLVFATGATPIIPPLADRRAELLITMNSLEEYRRAEARLGSATSVLVIGAGLVGTEIAMDLSSSGRKVSLTDRADRLMPGLLPDFLSAQLVQTMVQQGCQMKLGNEVIALNFHGKSGIEAAFADGSVQVVDCVISAIGLRPNKFLAEKAGLQVNRGIVVNNQLQTSDKDIYALGDCAEITEKVLPFLQPIMLSANALARTLTGSPASVQLPAMMVKVKTPLLPMQLSGMTACQDALWKIEKSSNGMLARAFNDEEQMIGFAATQEMMPKAFGLLRELPAVI